MLRPVLAAALALLAIPACTVGDPPAGARSGELDASPARHASVPGETACADPYGAWCGHEGEADRDRAERLLAISRSIEDVREVERRVAPLRAIADAELARVVALARARVRATVPSAERDAALARLDRAHLAWLELDDPSPFHARAMRRGCGESLLVDDAWVDKSATAITLCPGFLLVSREGADDAELRARIALLLAHEVGHVILGPTESSVEAERAAEIAADEWAAGMVADLAAEIADPAARERFLVLAIEPICAPSGDRIHPGGAERVAIYARSLCAR